MRLAHVFHALLAASCIAAADPAPKVDPIRLPVVPTPAPAPAPPPAAVTALAADQVYVIDSDVPCIVLASPAGIVTVAEDAGPIKVRGMFVDGGGKPESRTYKGKVVYTVEAAATGRVELLIVPQGGSAGDVIRRTLDVTSTRPLPPPPTPPNPTPEPTPTPVALWGFVVVEDTAAAVAARGAMLSDPALAALLKGRNYRWRIIDKDVAGADGNPPADVGPCLNAAKGKALPQVFLIDAKGGIVTQAQLSSATQLVDLLKRYGG